MAWIEKRGNGWRVVWDVGSPESRQRRTEYFDDWEDAVRLRKKIDYETSTGICVDPTKMTVSEYFDHWIKLHEDNLAPKTLSSYKCEIKNHIKPNLGSIKLVKLKPMHLQNYYDHLKKEGRSDLVKRELKKLQEEYDKAISEKRNGKPIQNKINKVKQRLDSMKTEGNEGLSPTSINYQQRIIHKALKQAVKWQMIGYNVADAVEPPKPVKKEIGYLKKDQIHKFTACIQKSPEYPIILTAILTGMRQGEILGLRWQDVDFDLGIIHVRQQLQYIPELGYYFKKPKKESVRVIPMPLPLNAVLRNVKKDQQAIKKIFAETKMNSSVEELKDDNKTDGSKNNDYNDFNLIFCRYNGSPLDGTGVTKRFQHLLDQNGFPKIRFHALRHTFATMCRAAGMDLSSVQDLLGHADISTTKRMYTHVEIEPLRKAMEMFTDFMEIKA